MNHDLSLALNLPSVLTEDQAKAWVNVFTFSNGYAGSTETEESISGYYLVPTWVYYEGTWIEVTDDFEVLWAHYLAPMGAGETFTSRFYFDMADALPGYYDVVGVLDVEEVNNQPIENDVFIQSFSYLEPWMQTVQYSDLSILNLSLDQSDYASTGTVEYTIDYIYTGPTALTDVTFHGMVGSNRFMTFEDDVDSVTVPSILPNQIGTLTGTIEIDGLLDAGNYFAAIEVDRDNHHVDFDKSNNISNIVEFTVDGGDPTDFGYGFHTGWYFEIRMDTEIISTVQELQELYGWHLTKDDHYGWNVSWFHGWNYGWNAGPSGWEVSWHKGWAYGWNVSNYFGWGWVLGTYTDLVDVHTYSWSFSLGDLRTADQFSPYLGWVNTDFGYGIGFQPFHPSTTDGKEPLSGPVTQIQLDSTSSTSSWEYGWHVSWFHDWNYGWNAGPSGWVASWHVGWSYGWNVGSYLHTEYFAEFSLTTDVYGDLPYGGFQSPNDDTIFGMAWGALNDGDVYAW